ncbi:hypothetical protein [Streptomyces sp. 1114.5]|uniref:hypothetical protein n=1 Tax=Streptomyces sp. 1114.5 TaxID=1938830 RepID=UPI0037D9B576
MTVAWFTIEDLGALVRRHHVDDSVSKAITRITRTDLIIVDLCRDRDYAEKAVGKPDCGLCGGCSARHSRRQEDLSCPGIRTLLEDDEPAWLVGGPEVDPIEEVIAGAAVGVDDRWARRDEGDPGSQQPSGNGHARPVLRVDSRAGEGELASWGSQVHLHDVLSCRLDHWRGRVDGDQRFDHVIPCGADGD